MCKIIPLQSPAMTSSLFTLISLFYVYSAYQLLRTIYRDWANFIAEPLTLHKKSLVERGAFLIAVPPSVLLHELFHAIAVWLIGGRVVGGGFFFFWGYISHIGNYTPFERWAISFAGTVGSMVFGVLLWLALRRNRSSTLRYFGLRSLRMQIILSLIFYPIFTLVFPEGDWRTIYDFGATPVWSGLTAVFHALTLLLYWFAERQGRFEQVAFDSVKSEAQFKELNDSGVADQQAKLRQIQFLRHGGATNRAKQLLQTYLTEYPEDAAAHFEAGLLQLTQGDKIPHTAIPPLKQAVALNLQDARKKIVAYQIIGQYHQRGNELEEAINQYSMALETAVAQSNNSPAHPKQLAALYQLRSQAYQQANQLDLARQDAQNALEIAKQHQDQAAIEQYQHELSTIEQRINRSSI